MGITGERLAERFSSFCDTLDRAERIDSLAFGAKERRDKKADYFFAGRRIVCEIKSLETDTTGKLVRTLADAGIPVSEGTHVLDQVLAGHSDKDVLYRKCLNVIATAVADGVDEANRQIRTTKKTFGLEESDGLLVILHGQVAVLNPDVILNRVLERFRKNTPAGRPAHEHVSLVLLISEIHKLKTTDGRLLAAAIPVANPRVSDRFGVTAFANAMIDGWAKWNKRTLSVINASTLR